MVEVSRREKQEGIIPDPDVDTYIKVLLVSLSSFSPLFLALPICIISNRMSLVYNVTSREAAACFYTGFCWLYKGYDDI